MAIEAAAAEAALLAQKEKGGKKGKGKAVVEDKSAEGDNKVAEEPAKKATAE